MGFIWDVRCKSFDTQVRANKVVHETRKGLTITVDFYQYYWLLKHNCITYHLIISYRGYGPDWYVNQWGHTLCRRLINLRRSLQKSKSPILTYELEDSISRPSPPPYSTITTTTTTTTAITTSTHIPISSSTTDTSSILTDILINRF